jgi:flagellar biosynthesis protein FliR
VLGSGNFPLVAKIGFTGLFAMLLTPHVTVGQGEAIPSEALALAVMGVGELAIGLLMGFVMTLVFAAVQVGGQIMDLQTGFGMMNVFNPAFESQFPIYGFFYFIIAVLYLLTINGHHLMIWAMANTFDKIPLGGFVWRPELLREISTWGSAMYLDGLLIAAPVAGAMFLTYASLGLLGRVVPQIHLFVVGFPLTIALGLFIVGISLTFYLDVLDGMLGRMFQNVDTTIRGMM